MMFAATAATQIDTKLWPDVWKRTAKVELDADKAIVASVVFFAIVSGVPLAAGIFPGDAVGVIGCLSAVMVGRGFLSSKTFSLEQFMWLAALGASMFAGLAVNRTTAISAAIAAQSVTAPAVALSGSTAIAILVALGTAIASASGFVAACSRARTQGFDGTFDNVLRLGTVVVSAVAVASSFVGSAPAQLLAGPIDASGLKTIAISAASAIALVVTVAYLSGNRFFGKGDRLAARIAPSTAVILGVSALIAVVVAR